MAFNNIAIDDGRVTGSHFPSNAVFILYGLHVFGDDIFYIEIIFFQMLQPLAAAGTGRASMNDDINWLAELSALTPALTTSKPIAKKVFNIFMVATPLLIRLFSMLMPDDKPGCVHARHQPSL